MNHRHLLELNPNETVATKKPVFFFWTIKKAKLTPKIKLMTHFPSVHRRKRNFSKKISTLVKLMKISPLGYLG